MSRHFSRTAIAIAVLSTTLIALPAASTSAAATSPGVLAQFEGRTIDLSEDWGEATACSITTVGATCYRTEQEMDAAFAVTLRVALSLRGLFGILSNCVTQVKLYDGTSYGGTVLQLWGRQTHVLSTSGFDNVTSSYKIGACDAEFYSGISTGPYPGNTSAGAQSTAMVAGWDNIVSSIYIY
jgi:hypothetical protein